MQVVIAAAVVAGAAVEVDAEGPLGWRLAIDLAGQAKFGPDVQWVGDPQDLQVDPARGEGFYAQIRRYWPGLPDAALVPGYAGMRPKLQAPGEDARDFLIQGPADHGVPGLVNLFGIESPGLTARATRREDCNDCLDCFAACPEQHVIRLPLKGAHKGVGPMIKDSDCTSCGRCIDVCAKDVFQFVPRFAPNADDQARPGAQPEQ